MRPVSSPVGAVRWTPPTDDDVNVSVTVDAASSGTRLGRRRSFRHPVRHEVQVGMAVPGWALNLVDISAGGFLVESPQPLPLGESLDFVFRCSATGGLARLAARAVHTRNEHRPGRGMRHLAGFAFDDLVRTDVLDAVEHLIAAVADQR